MTLSTLQPHCDSILVLDTETSGLSCRMDEIIEFAAVRLVWDGSDFVTDAEVDEFVRRTNDRRLDPRIVELTGITDELLRE